MRYYLALIGVVLLAGAGWLFLRRLALVIDGVVTVGRVESFEARNADESTAYHPVVVFRDHEHRIHRFTSVTANDESDEYMHDSKNIALVSLGAVLSVDDSFRDLLESPAGSAFIRNASTAHFEKDAG